MKISGKVIHIFFSFILLSLSAAVVHAETQILGGVETEGTLRIAIYDNGNMAVHRYVGTSWQQQWFDGNCKSTLCYIDGTNYAVEGSYYNGGWFSSYATPLTFISNTSSIDTAELVLEKPDVVRIKQTIYYPPGAAHYTLQWEITNLSGSAMNDLRFFSGGDTYLSGIDYGSGVWKGEENAVGVTKILDGTTEQYMYIQGNTIPYAYESRQYQSVGKSVVANALTNAIDPEWVDNGMAMEWRTQSLPAGAVWTINATEKFVTKSVSNVTVSAPISSQIAPGASVDLIYTVTNLTDVETSVTLNEEVDLEGWTAIIQSPSSPFNLPGNASQSVRLAVTCPPDTLLGTVAKVTLEATTSIGSASDFCSVEAAQVPTITSHPSDFFACIDESATFAVSADNAISYQWQEFSGSWHNVIDEGIYSGATSNTLSISTAAADMNGYKYRCVATNDYGSATSNTATLIVSSCSPTTFYYTLSGGTGVETDYRIFTVPLDLGTGADMQAQMEAVLGPYDIRNWRVFAYDGTSYPEMTAAEFDALDVLPGRAFWIITLYTDVIPFEGLPAPDGVDFKITLSPGWHLFASPWTETAVDPSHISVTDGTSTYFITDEGNPLTAHVMWEYTGTGPYSGYDIRGAGDVLTPGTGYFFLVTSQSDVTVIIPPNSSAPGHFTVVSDKWQKKRKVKRVYQGQLPPPPPGGQARP